MKDLLHLNEDPVQDLGKTLSAIGRTFRLVESGIGIFDDLSNTSIEVDRSIIFFFFSDREFVIKSSESENDIASGRDSYLMCAYPFQDWQLEVSGEGVRGVAFSIGKLHELFGNLTLNDPSDLREALKNYRSKSFYTRRKFSPKVQLMIHEVFVKCGEGVAGTLMIKAKLMEILSIYMQPDLQSLPADDCPYITDNLDWEKIREAERILLEDICNPPTIKELAKLVGTNELKLKTGFKHLFGNTIYGYLTDYRMDYARLNFETSRVQVKEVAARVGYSNPSHFIAAFRKRFGVTPKKYIQSLAD